MGVTQIKECYRFKDGQILVESDEYSGRPMSRTLETIKKIWRLVMEEHQITIGEMGISYGS